MQKSLILAVILAFLSYGIECSRVISAKSHALVQPALVEGNSPAISSMLLSIRGGADGKVQDVESLEQVQQICAENPDKLVVIDFTAVWCGPCKAIAPKFAEMSEDPAFGNVIFLKCDIEVSPETAKKFGVFQMPTFTFIKNSEVVHRFSGANPVKLREALEEHCA
eukprot:CAMPEP_0113945272 /NCGR_PEP_ID=MMETSP1339-20121228/43378_1 /TAXON_ID=94617 /ORGANISM="Fibrocapsa japonica" /LENGTH=165 /DNA_ID=CAMNT_0000950773 /DNA_START=37 /DNA_END=534 /DNA_ORIENTATION=- /assembly_acc=CAM_ASM_000762